MKAKTKREIRKHFEQTTTKIFWPSDLANFVAERRSEWDDPNLSTKQMEKFLLKEGLLFRAEFTSAKYRPIVRYLRGKPSPYQLAVSLRRNSFLSHRTALMIHGFEPPTTTKIYVNQEQRPKPAPEGITQESINLAFKNQQRQSNYIFKYGSSQFVLLSGKATGRAGVVHSKGPNGETITATDLERTLIDIVVRPAYAGGLKRVVAVYKEVAPKLGVDHMIKLFQKLDYAHPYHQSIGFLLERAGCTARDCTRFKDFGLEFDFYLDFGLKHPAYDQNWRLFYPSLLDK